MMDCDSVVRGQRAGLIDFLRLFKSDYGSRGDAIRSFWPTRDASCTPTANPRCTTATCSEVDIPTLTRTT